jgi:hypothetical protein
MCLWRRKVIKHMRSKARAFVQVVMQSDQIGRIFAHWAIYFSVQFYEN